MIRFFTPNLGVWVRTQRAVPMLLLCLLAVSACTNTFLQGKPTSTNDFSESAQAGNSNAHNSAEQNEISREDLRAHLAQSVQDMSPTAQKTYLFLLLDNAIRQEDSVLVDEAVHTLLRVDPSEDVFISGAAYYASLDNMDKARSVLQRGRALYPASPKLAMGLADVYIQEQRKDAAIVTLQDFLAEHPENNDSRLILAAQLIAVQRFAEAADTLTAIPAEKRNASMQYYLAKAFIGLNKLDDAETLLHKITAQNEQLLEAWAELAYIYELRKDYPKAERTYTHILSLVNAKNTDKTDAEQNSNAIAVWLRLVSLNLGMNNPDKALEYVHQGPDNIGFLLDSGKLFLEQSFFKQADIILRPLLERKNHPDELYFFLAVIEHDYKKDSKSALALLDNISVENPYHERALLFAIAIESQAGQWHEVASSIKEGKKAHPESARFWQMEADLAVQQKKPQEALDILQKAQELWPENSNILYNFAMVQDELGQKTEALASMERVILLDNSNYNALNYIAYSLAEQEKDLPRALILAHEAVKLRAGNPFITDTLAWVYFKLGNNTLALEHSKMALSFQNGKNEPVLWEHFGDIARAEKAYGVARQAYTKALQLQHPDAAAIKAKINALPQGK